MSRANCRPFYLQLRYERELRGWSQADLAAKVRSEPRTIARWEGGKSLPRPYHRRALCELFNKTAEELGLVTGQFPFIPSPSEEANVSALALPENSSNGLASPSDSQRKTHQRLLGLPPPTSARTIQQREQTVQAIYGQLLQDETTAVVLTGIGGVGKSTLAALVYRYAEEQRRANHGILSTETLWLTITERVTMADFMATLFEAFAYPLSDWSTLPPQSQAVALLDLLNSREETRLIILDQFENLLDLQTGYILSDRPGVGEWLDAINSQPCRCRFLLTSRLWPRGTREYPPTYLQEYQVYGLDDVEGTELLQKQGVHAHVSDLRTAVQRCEGHAFSLVLLASLLRTHQIPLTALFTNGLYTQLWDGNMARNFLDSIFMLQLTPRERDILVAFSIFREPMGLEAASTLLSSPVDGKKVMPEDVETLLSHCLLQASGDGKYRLHAIVANYAQAHHDGRSEQTNDLMLRSAHSRAAQYYHQQALLHFPPKEERLRVKDVQPLVEAVWHFCQASEWKQAYTLMEEEKLFSELRHWGGNAILLELCTLLQTAKDEDWSPTPHQQAIITSSLGWVYGALGQRKQARASYEEALKRYRQAKDSRGENRTLSDLGWDYLTQGQLRKALAYYEQSLQLCEQLGDHIGTAFNYNCLGWIYSALGKKQQATTLCFHALHLCEEIEDRNGKGRALHALGRISLDLGKHQQALRYLEEALAIRQSMGRRRGEGTTLTHIGRVYRCLQQYEQALHYLEQASQIHQEIGDRGLASLTLYHQGLVYTDLKQYEQAQGLLEQSLSLRHELGDLFNEGRTINALGRVYEALGKEEQALECYKQALHTSQEVEDLWGEGNASYSLGVFYLKKSSDDPALSYLLTAERCFESVQSSELQEVRALLERKNAS